MRFSDAEIHSTGAFLQGELERLDPQLYEPITDFTWGRDIDLREDVTIADEVSSFIFTNYAGGFGGTGVGAKSWFKDKGTTPAQIEISQTKVMSPMTVWAMEVVYTIIELQKAMQAGRPIDRQKFDAMRVKHQLDIDTQVYVGDDELGMTGLLNSDDKVTSENIGAYTKGTTTPAEVIDMFSTVQNNAWKATAYTRIPNRILVAPELYSDMAATQLPNVNMSLLNYIKANSLTTSAGGTLEILPCKWLADTSRFTNPRLVAYTKAVDVVRFPLVQLQSVPVQYRGLAQAVPYYAALGAVEFVRPEMVYYGVLAD